MQSLAGQMHAGMATGAAVWPLLAGLSVVLWSKARAQRAMARARAR